MTTQRWASDELLEVIACDIESRPAAAPGVDALAPFVRSAQRLPGELLLQLDPAGRTVAEAFVAAECVCCASIGWSLIETPALALRVTATEPQIEALTALVPTSIYIESNQ